MSTPPLEDEQDFSQWINNSETVEDVASAAAMDKLRALLDNDSSSENMFELGHWLHFAPTAPQSELGVDGHPKLGGFMPPIPFPRRMWASSKIAFHQPIPLGQKITRTTTIESVTPKTGSTGDLIFVVLRHDVSAAEGLALTEHQTIVYREAPKDAASPESAAAPARQVSGEPEGWDWVDTAQPNETALFRFSALTFNSHRIHYDYAYATQVEKYPGLVVHGPFSATMLLHAFLKKHPEATVTGFSFQARAPLFVNETLRICGRAKEDGTEELAILDPNAKSAVVATVQYN